MRGAALFAVGDGEVLVRAVLLQIVVILVAARVAAVVVRRLGQPAVVGEFLAGLALGPSLLGRWQPELFAALFRPSLAGMTPEQSALLVEQVLAFTAHLGLIFLLFLVGLEVDGRYFRRGWGQPMAIAGVGLLVPLLVGLPVGYGLAWGEGVIRDEGLLSPAALFVAAAFAITALPVLARILIDLGVLGTHLARLALASAAITDGIMWCLLAGITAWVSRHEVGWTSGQSLLYLAAFVLVMGLIIRPLGRNYLRLALQGGGGRLSLPVWTVLLVLLLLSAYTASGIGIHAWFGAFALGVALASVPGFPAEATARLRTLTQGFFLPIFFAYAGLRTDVFVMLSVWSWPVCLGVLAAAALVKWIPCTLAARWHGLSWREAALMGSLMNTRGLMGLVVASIGRDVGALSPGLFALLVLLAEIMTLLTTPLVLLLARGTEWEAPLRASGWLQPQSVPTAVTSTPTPEAIPSASEAPPIMKK
jgi:Kef-type K+ transport system membrane component KefB